MVLSFKNGDNDPTRDSFGRYCIPLGKIKDFNALIDNKRLFDQPNKIKQEIYEKVVKMSKNNGYAAT